MSANTAATGILNFRRMQSKPTEKQAESYVIVM